MKVAVIGTGYVGLVQGAGLASINHGHHVVCIDKDEARIHALRAGRVPFYEPGLAERVKEGVDSGRLTFSADIGHALRSHAADVIFIAVGTPSAEDGSADLTALKQACHAILDCAPGRPVVAVKSTIPPGTTRNVVAPLVSPFPVVFNPEFLAEGTALADFDEPSRIVLGSNDEQALARMKVLYAAHIASLDHVPVFTMDQTSAELVKYASNAMLAARVALINEVAAVADAVGADIAKAAPAIGADPRVGPHFLKAGVGYGGSCFSKDVSALAYLARDQGLNDYVLEAVMHANEESRLRAAEAVEEMVTQAMGATPRDIARPLEGLKVGVWGLSFKPGTDDVRDSPAIAIVQQLLRRGAKVAVFDPKGMERARRILDGAVTWAPNAVEAAVGAHMLCLLTEWPEFNRPEVLEAAHLAMRSRERPADPAFLLFDGRNAIEPELAKRLGFTYRGVGRR